MMRRLITTLAAVVCLAAPAAAQIDPAARGMAAAAQAQLSTAPAAAPYYLSMIPARQTTGSPADVTGHGGHANIGISLGVGGTWANPGYASTATGTGLGQYIPISRALFDVAFQSIIFSITLNCSPPSSSSVFFGNGNSSAGVQGLFLNVDTGGHIRPLITTSTTVGLPLTFPSNTVFCDGTDHAVLIAIDAVTKDAALYSDGVLDVYTQNVLVGNTATIVSNFNIGSQGLLASSGISTTTAFKWRNLHLLRFNGGLPLNLGQIAQRIAAYPEAPLASSDITFASKLVALTIVGQSNEGGQGFWSNRSGLRGLPLADPVLPHGGASGSWWPYLSTLAGNRGAKLAVCNGAIGSTSLVSSWAGLVKAWTSNIQVQQGNLILSSGGIWKVAGSGAADGTLYTSTIAPTGTSNITTNTGAEPNWNYLGIPSATDVVGRVQQFGDTHFDPNGYLATALSCVTARPVFSGNLWAIVSIGQGDFTIGSTKTQYQMALQNITDYFIANGVHVALGMTLYDAAPNADAYYTSTLYPARAAALAHYSGNAKVVSGADLRSVLGVLSVNNQFICSLKIDTVHANDNCSPIASEAWDAALQAAGAY